MTCNHTDGRECQNCEPPAVAWDRRPGRCGGRACFIGTRIPVDHIVALGRRGWGPEQIVLEYPQLTVGQIRKALLVSA